MRWLHDLRRDLTDHTYPEAGNGNGSFPRRTNVRPRTTPRAAFPPSSLVNASVVRDLQTVAFSDDGDGGTTRGTKAWAEVSTTTDALLSPRTKHPPKGSSRAGGGDKAQRRQRGVPV